MIAFFDDRSMTLGDGSVHASVMPQVTEGQAFGDRRDRCDGLFVQSRIRAQEEFVRQSVTNCHPSRIKHQSTPQQEIHG